MSALILPEHLGPDKAGRGAGWDKTNAGMNVTMALHDCAQRHGYGPGQLLGAMVESLISFLQASAAPHAWGDAGAKVTDEIMKRMTRR